MSTTTVVTALVHERCCRCGVLFGLERGHQRRLLDNPGTSFFCPNGHSQHYVGESEAERERRARTRAEGLLAQERAEHADTRRLRNAAERRLTAQRGATTRLKNRVKHGVCPCCQRTFANVARHMATKHPTFGEASAK